MSIFDHPGFMEYEGGTIEVLHADWPVYPAGHSWQVALQALGVFPEGVKFQQIDNIDQCYLFVAVGSETCLKPVKPLTDERWFHVAIWHEDLFELHRRGLISGVTILTEYEAALAYYEKHKDLHAELDGVHRPLNLPDPVREDFENAVPTVPEIAEEGVAVTSAGKTILRTLARPVAELDNKIRQRVEPLLSIPFYDTAVRETGVLLESRLRGVTGSKAFGQALVEEYYKVLCARYSGNPRAIFRILRSELRTIFKFVRNDFAHALQDITESQCRVLLDRISLALERINEIESEESRKG